MTYTYRQVVGWMHFLERYHERRMPKDAKSRRR